MKNNANNNVNPPKTSSIVIFVIVGILITIFICFLLEQRSDKGFNGCYYITDAFIKGKDPEISLCITKKSTTFTINGKSTELYNKFYSDEMLDIRNSYNETLFSCQLNKDDHNKIKCNSHDEALGSGYWVWEK